MPGRWIETGQLGIQRLLIVFAALAVALLAALAIAPVRDHATEWRTVQQRYNAQAKQVGAPTVAVGIKQIWKPELDAVDRCVSCHLGMGEATPSPHEPLYAAHPRMAHEPRDLGCTACHGGQGRATRRADAHGEVEFWDEPMLARGDLEAGCGSCHTHLPVAPPAVLERGEIAFAQAACFDCHRVDGKGRGDGPDLSHVGLAGFAAGWYDDHLARVATGEGAWPTSFGPLEAADRAALAAYLSARVGAPRLLRGKALGLSYGCRGCHKINGVGGDEGPDLSQIGARPASLLDFRGVTGPHTLRNWLAQHFIDPARVVPGSQMPALGMTADEADLLTVYMLSLRPRVLPEAMIPPDRARGLVLGQREFGGDGEALYGAFCAGCHGPRGAGRRLGTGELTFPAIGSADYLAVVDDGLLVATVRSGRPGRKMPAWGERAGGLDAAEVDAVVGYLRGLEPAPVELARVAAAPVDPTLGRALWEQDCRACHGARGEGSAIGPAVGAGHGAREPLYRRLVSRTPGMGAYRSYAAAELAALAGHVASLPAAPPPARPWRAGLGDAERGAALYAESCAGCHGERGAGKVGPALGNPAFLRAASDGYLAAAIARGRGGTAMPGFASPGSGFRALAGDEIADLVAYLRSLAQPAAKKEQP